MRCSVNRFAVAFAVFLAALSGPSSARVSQVPSATGVVAFAASLTAGTTCHRDGASGCDVYMGDIDLRTGLISNTLLIDGSAGAQWFPSLSPNGRMLAYSNTAVTPNQVIVLDLPSRATRQVINGGKFPAFSADSTRLYYSTPQSGIQVLDVSTGVSTVVPIGGVGTDPHPVGVRYVAYHEEVDGAAAPLVHDLTTHLDARPAVSVRCGHVVVNPGQNKIGCTTPASTRLWVSDLAGGVWSPFAVAVGPLDAAIATAAPELSGAAALFMGYVGWPSESLLISGIEAAVASGNPAQPYTTTRARLVVIDVSGSTPTVIPVSVHGFPDAQTQTASVLMGQTMHGVTGVIVTPAFREAPSAQAVTAGGSVSMTAVPVGSPAPSVRWQQSLDAGLNYVDVINASPYTGASTNTLLITGVPAGLHGARFRAVATNAAGTATSSAATLTVRGAVAVSPTSLRFAVVKAGASGAVTSATDVQAVSVSFEGGPSIWTVSSNQSWLVVTGGAATAGRLTATIANPGNVIGSATALSGTITITAATAPNTPVTVPVTVTVDQTNGASGVGPIGGVDTPASNSINIVGAIAVTGWALDDIGVERVEIWRNCLTPVDANRAGVCRQATPTGLLDKVFIGTAAFVPGARTDIETNPIYAGYPQAYRAGWGYLLLTNALPNQASGATEGGQGPITLYAYAIDREGRYTELGSKAVTLNNDNATVPFGAIDTPEQGGTVTAAVSANFGWAMTRRRNAAGVDIPKCIERTRYRVFIDGVARTLTTGVNWHPNLVRADLTAAYPGLCDSANSLAAYYLDVTALGLANGLHTIGWDVYDDNGTTATQADDNVAGIGSRFFNILVGAGDVPNVGRGFSRAESGDRLTGRPVKRGETADITALPATESRELRARVGAVEAPVVAVAGDTAGRHAVNLPQGHRLAVDLGGAVTRGYLVVGDELRDLPIGSTLDAARGQFYWQPAVPYFGPFELAFVSSGDGGTELRTNLSGTITDPTVGGEPEVTITSPRAGANPNPVITVTGTARDPRALSATGISAVHVWARRLDRGPGVQGSNGPEVQFFGEADLARDQYTLTSSPLAAGTYQIEVYAWVARLGTWAPAVTVTIAVR